MSHQILGHGLHTSITAARCPQPFGVPYAIWGMAYILIFSFLLPGHEGAGHTDLTSELLVTDK